MEDPFQEFAIKKILKQNAHDCYQDDKDDFDPPSRKTFIALFFVTLAVGTLLSYNGYLMVKTKRVPKNVPLTMFLCCATTTILGKFSLLILYL
jgi:hypothetical protein